MSRTLSESELVALDFSTLPQTQEFPAMQFFPTEWLTGVATMAMSPEQRGGFVDLLAHAWGQKPPCSLPDDSTQLAGYSRIGTARWSKVGQLIRQQFVKCSDGRLRNPKQVAVWLSMKNLREKRSKAPKGKQNSDFVSTKEEVCTNKASVLFTPAIAAPTAAPEVSFSLEGEREREPLPPGPSRASFEAAARILPRLSDPELGMKTLPSAHVLAGWVEDYGERVVMRAIAKAEPRLKGKHYTYLAPVLLECQNEPQGAPDANVGASELPNGQRVDEVREFALELRAALRAKRWHRDEDRDECEAYIAAIEGLDASEAPTFEEWRRRGAA